MTKTIWIARSDTDGTVFVEVFATQDLAIAAVLDWASCHTESDLGITYRDALLREGQIVLGDDEEYLVYEDTLHGSEA